MTFQKNNPNPFATDVLINFVLDQSGSMQSVRQATVDGFNDFIQQQVNNADGKLYVSLTLFNTGFDVRFAAREASEVPRLGGIGNPYSPSGGTSLYDAAAVSISGTEEWLRNHPSFNGKVLTVIWTDGEENSSKIYSRHAVNSLIDAKQGQGWIFQFMGTGEEGWLQNDVFSSIPVSNRGWTARSASGMHAGYASMNNSVATLRSSGNYTWGGDQYVDSQ